MLTLLQVPPFSSPPPTPTSLSPALIESLYVFFLHPILYSKSSFYGLKYIVVIYVNKIKLLSTSSNIIVDWHVYTLAFLPAKTL